MLQKPNMNATPELPFSKLLSEENTHARHVKKSLFVPTIAKQINQEHLCENEEGKFFQTIPVYFIIRDI